MFFRSKSSTQVFEVIGSLRNEGKEGRGGGGGRGGRTRIVNGKGGYMISLMAQSNVFFTKFFSFTLGRVLTLFLIHFRYSMK